MIKKALNIKLLKEWDYEKNNELSIYPDKLSSFEPKIWWICPKGHSYKAQIRNRINGSNCPICANKQILKGYNDLATKYPELLKEWDYEKNNELGIYPDAIGAGSHKKVWWKCDKGHSYDMKINYKISKKIFGCPICSSHRILKGYNDLATTHSELLKEWDYGKNNELGIYPDKIFANSKKRVWWKCDKGHSWQISPNSKKKCPYCLNNKALKGYNDLATKYPELLKEWDYKKNGNLKPEKIVYGSSKEVWWKCQKCGYKWKKRIVDRTVVGKGCPACACKVVAEGINDLATKYPELLKEWDYEKNNELGIYPDKINFRSLKYVYWICSKGHSWKTKINYRTIGKTNCPVCENLKVQVGYNDLETLCPQLAEEWDYEKNLKKPTEVVCNSTYKAHWICKKKGHEWVASVGSRYRGNGCPICSKELRISFPEKAIVYYLLKKKYDLIENYRPTWLNGKEIDIYLPGKKVGIEFDGERWHKNYRLDKKKDEICKKNNVVLYRIREKNCPHYISDSKKIFMINNNYDGLDDAINQLFKLLNDTGHNVNVKNDELFIEELIDRSAKENSILNIMPNLLEKWDYEKNGNLKPENYSINSHKEVWWKCDKGHSYKRGIRSEALEKRNCPICVNQLIVPGLNDFATKYPELLKEWDYEKNEVDPTKINLNGDKYIWWICPKGHSYKATIYARAKNGTGCPYCSGRYAIKGENDLKTLRPDLCKEWDYKKNGNLKPENYKCNSHQNINWICPKGHSYKATIQERNNGKKCPKCKNK